MFVQYHFLTDYAASLPNRDQNGNAKRIYYGNAERLRISSQSFKAALRSANHLVRYDPGNNRLVADNMADLANNLGAGMAVRSRYVLPRRFLPLLTEDFAERGFDGNPMEYVEAVMSMFTRGKTEEEDADGAGDENGEGVAEDISIDSLRLKQPVVIGEQEIGALVKVVAGMAADGVVPKDIPARVLMAIQGKIGRVRGKGDKKSGKNDADEAAVVLSEDTVAAIDNFRMSMRRPGLDGILFGRFSSTNLFHSVRAAVGFAHLLTVHPTMSTADYFTVMDTEKRDGEMGASHANTAELTSGLYYGYAVLDLRVLAESLPMATPEDLGAIAAWMVRGIYQSESAAKIGSTAPFKGVSEILVEVGRRQPRSLMGAYQRAILPGSLSTSLSEDAISRLRSYVAEADRRGGQPDIMQAWLSEASPEKAGMLAGYEALAVRLNKVVAESSGEFLEEWRVNLTAGV